MARIMIFNDRYCLKDDHDQHFQDKPQPHAMGAIENNKQYGWLIVVMQRCCNPLMIWTTL